MVLRLQLSLHLCNALTLPLQVRRPGGRRLISMASKGENDTATSVTIDILRKQPGDKAIIIMIADAFL